MNDHRIKLLQQYIENEPENPFNHYALAMEYYEVQPEKSLDLLEELSQKRPDYLPTYFKLAHLYWEYDNLDRAETIFKKGIELAEEQSDQKTLEELKVAYQNFLYE